MQPSVKERCVVCGYLSDDNSPVGGESGIDTADGKLAPKPGDITLCIGCGKPYQFDDDLRRTPLSTKDLRGLPTSVRAEIERVQAAQRELMRGKRVIAGRIVD